MAARLTPPILSETPGADLQEQSANPVISDLFGPPPSEPAADPIHRQAAGRVSGSPGNSTATTRQLLLHYRARERDLQADLTCSQQQLEAARRQLIDLKQHQRRLNAALALAQRRQQERPRLRALLLRLRAEKHRLQDQLAQGQEELATARRQAVNLRKQQHQQSRSRARLERRQISQLDELQQQLSATRQQLQEAQGQEQALRSQLREAQLEADGDRQRHRALMQQRQRERSRLAVLLLKLRAHRHELSAGLRTAREQVNSTQRDLAALRRQQYRQDQGQARLERRHLAQLLDLQRQLASTREQLDSLPGQPASPAPAAQQLGEWLAQEREMRRHLEQHSQRECTRLEQELLSLQALLEDLPGIYESKFRQRLRPLLEQRDWLLQNNAQLRSLLPPETMPPGRLARLPQAPAPSRPRLGRYLKALFRPDAEASETGTVASEPTAPA